MNSCPWGLNKANLAKFHEEEWGRPVHEDNKLFEFLSLSVLAADCHTRPSLISEMICAWHFMISKLIRLRRCH